MDNRMDFGTLSKKNSHRRFTYPLITFGLFLALAIMNVYQHYKMKNMEEILHDKLFLSKSDVNEKRVKKSVDSKPGHGSLYTRWGRKSCPNTTDLVYEGVVGGQSNKNTGGGSNILCLPKNPIWANFTTAVENGASIFGSEYQLEAYTADPLFSLANAENLHQHDVPCAVCLTKEPAVVMMLPSRSYCYPGWTIEYAGYLMAEGNTHQGRHDYVCVDNAPETIPASNADKDGALMYFVQSICGPLPCVVYRNGFELSCAVCSKY